MYRLFVEAIVVGIIMVIFGNIASFIVAPFLKADLPKNYTTKSRKYGKVCIVGNGPISEENRRFIASRECDTVVRFNDMKNRTGNERVDVHVQREWKDTQEYAGSDIAAGAPKYLVGMHAAVDAVGSDTAIPTRGMYGFQSFPTCSKRSGAVDKHPSTGTIVLSVLELDPSVERMDVFGMNWKFEKEQGHDGVGEGTLVQNCCTKCNFHPTPTQTYMPDEWYDPIWNKFYTMAKLFLTGFLIHLFSEFSGINKWYCKKGFACLR